MLEIIATIGALLVVGTYFIGTYTERPLVFHWGNVVGAVMIVPINIVLGLWFAVFMTGTFGLIGLTGVVRDALHSRGGVS